MRPCHNLRASLRISGAEFLRDIKRLRTVAEHDRAGDERTHLSPSGVDQAGFHARRIAFGSSLTMKMKFNINES
ncbi:hypothetical protein [Rosistilla oblonga]|uniref:hypothetical protein n=1 Tax=Rosistilla oblonga TaxID=2527990 RepID=UPI001E5C1542|nr:hypothetical protein [Rosistilla oblonga]